MKTVTISSDALGQLYLAALSSLRFSSCHLCGYVPHDPACPLIVARVALERAGAVPDGAPLEVK